MNRLIVVLAVLALSASAQAGSLVATIGADDSTQAIPAGWEAKAVAMVNVHMDEQCAQAGLAVACTKAQLLVVNPDADAFDRNDQGAADWIIWLVTPFAKAKIDTGYDNLVAGRVNTKFQSASNATQIAVCQVIDGTDDCSG